MKIESITLREIQMPLKHFFETSFGRTTGRRILLVTLHCQGHDAWGECVAGEHPFYSEESVETAWYAIENYLAPALVGKTLSEGAQCVPLFGQVRGHRMAKAALENAVWAAEAAEKNVPLFQLLGGTRMQVPCGVSIGIQDSPPKLMEKIGLELEAGYRRIKVKCKPGWDIEIFAEIRRLWPGITLSCDANSAYTLGDADHLRKFDQFNLMMIEQPLWADDIFFHAALQKQLRTAICLDESIRNANDAALATELGACRIINIKVGRVGGFSQAIKVDEVCREHGVPVWCGGMLESGIGRVHNLALSTRENFSLPGDVSASSRYWNEDIIEPEVTVSAGGYIAIGDQPGTGYAVKEKLIEKLTTRKVRISPRVN